MRAESQALEHGTFLLEGIIIARAVAETVAEVLVVDIGLGVIERLLRVNALGASIRVHAEGALACRGQARSAAVASEVALREYLDEVVIAVALDGAGVADAGGLVRRTGIIGSWVAGQAGKDALL